MKHKIIRRCVNKLMDFNFLCAYNSSAWMTGTIFNEWLGILNKQFVKENRKILLFMDNFAGQFDKQSNITVAFFPANCTSVLQPLDQGIIQAFKRKYPNQIVHEKLERLEKKLTHPVIDVKKAILMIKCAWDQITPATIANCYREAGFDKAGEQFLGEIGTSFNDNYDALCAQLNIDGQEFLDIDKNLRSSVSLTDDEIVEIVLDEINPKPSENVDSDSEKDPNESENDSIPIGTVLKSLDCLKDYMLSLTSDESEAVDQLFRMEKTIRDNMVIKQTKITSFFN